MRRRAHTLRPRTTNPTPRDLPAVEPGGAPLDLTQLVLLGAVAVHGTKRPSHREVEVVERSEVSSDKMGPRLQDPVLLGKSLGSAD